MQKITLNSSSNNSADSPTNEQTEIQGPEDLNPPATAVDETEKISQNQNSETDQSQTDQPLPVRPITFEPDATTMKKKQKKALLMICLLALIAGTATGFGAHRLQRQAAEPTEPIQQIAGDKVNAGDIFGLHDSELFKDSAQGYLEAGGINGEGSHKLLRIGGPSQTVYLTSSVTDLDKLVGMEVKVWGETYKGQVAGWLMDVGKIEVIDPQAEPPLEEEL